MQLSDFDYHLPQDLIARHPLPQRSQSALLRVNPEKNAFTHNTFYELPNFLEPGDCLVLNNTRVIPARLFGQKETGGHVEILVERILNEQEALVHLRASKRPKVGALIHLNCHSVLEVITFKDDLVHVLLHGSKPILKLLNESGEIPLPPYLERDAQEDDFIRYQTVYNQYEGSCAAPTAGLHFDLPLLDKIKAKGVSIAYITLHVGAGTFQPIRSEHIESHQLHAEFREIPQATCDLIFQTKKNGKRVIAVGTTTVRSLESACIGGKLEPCSGDTRLFIQPGFQFQCVDAMITNFHLPKTSLLMLVCAFGGTELIMNVYQEAVKQQYRFYSYGDAMFIENSRESNEV